MGDNIILRCASAFAVAALAAMVKSLPILAVAVLVVSLEVPAFAEKPDKPPGGSDKIQAEIDALTFGDGDLGGLEGADTECNLLAENAGFPGEFVAWLSTASVDALDWLAGSNGPWFNTNGGMVAATRCGSRYYGRWRSYRGWSRARWFTSETGYERRGQNQNEGRRKRQTHQDGDAVQCVGRAIAPKHGSNSCGLGGSTVVMV